MCISTVVQATIVLQLFSKALCQYPMPFPFPQMGAPQQMGSPQMRQSNMAPMAPIPPLPPQSMFPQQMPMNFPMPQRMPSVVMPYYSRSARGAGKKHRKKRRKHKRHEKSSETDNDSESSSSEHDYRRRSQKRRQVLTPVVSYVTKDGYVVYEKKIKKDKAKDWLEMNKKMQESQEKFSSTEERKFQEMLKYKKKKHHQHRH